MTVEEIKVLEKRNVLVGIRLDGQTREVLDWALVKVADPGDRVIALHVCRNSDSTSKEKPLLDDYLDDYEGLCNKKQVDLTGQVLRGSSLRKVLVREAKNRDAVALVLGISKHNALGLGRLASIARYCSKRLPPTTEVIVVHNGKVVFSRLSNRQLPVPGSPGDPKPSFHLTGGLNMKDNRSEFGDSVISDRRSCEVIPRENLSSLSSVSSYMGEITQMMPGWPLLRTATSLTPVTEARKMSVVKWVMSLPDRSLPEESMATPEDIPQNLKIKPQTSVSGCKWFSFDDLKTWTSQFSADNLIGEGRHNLVYRGLLPDGKPVAVKIPKSCETELKSFMLEIDIMSSLNHKNITPLLGICINDNNLISVYDFFSKGNLQENLDSAMVKTVLPWEVRFNIAIRVSEALNYLHNECSRPVIHRDIKSLNILLSEDYEPKLSDFGLAIWGSQGSSFWTHGDAVGTFGYFAPEYLLCGKVSDKIDVFSFGVVLLELLSGKNPINLIRWAKSKLESGDLKSILDPNLNKNVDEDQAQRMATAAALCLRQSARLRPNMSQILKILRGEKDVNESKNTLFGNSNDVENQDNNYDDEVYPDSCANSHLSTALLDVDDNSTIFSSLDNSPFSFEDHFNGRCTRSSSFMSNLSM